MTAKIATLQELEEDYSLDDLYRLAAYTKYQEDTQEVYEQIAKEQAKESTNV